MIDVSQWRASIGLWNYCQAASSRPANGRHSHSFKAAVDSKSGSTTSGEKTSKLPAALSHIAFLLLLFHSLSLLRHILMIPPTGKQQLQLCTCIFTGILLLGNCYQVQCTTGVTVTDTNYLQSVVLPGGSSSNLIYNDLYLIVCLRMLLLLSGDIELNPGPVIDDRPSRQLFAKCLKPLVDWKPFALCLPGIKQPHVNIIEENAIAAIHRIWLQVNPQASWVDVINALKQCEETKLAKDIEHQMKEPSEEIEDMEIIDLTDKAKSGKHNLNQPLVSTSKIGTNDAPTSTPVVSTVSSSVSVIDKPVTSTTSGKHTLNTTLIN